MNSAAAFMISCVDLLCSCICGLHIMHFKTSFAYVYRSVPVIVYSVFIQCFWLWMLYISTSCQYSRLGSNWVLVYFNPDNTWCESSWSCDHLRLWSICLWSFKLDYIHFRVLQIIKFVLKVNLSLSDKIEFRVSDSGIHFLRETQRFKRI
jgi:hypothetical protein